MGRFLDKLIVECELSDFRINSALNKEIPRVHLDTRQSESDDRPLACRLYAAKPIQEGEHTYVYRATLRVDGFKKPLDVVVKTDVYANTRRPEAFVREMQVYERDLLFLQGDTIPKFYGLFQARIDNIDGKPVSFLILKYSGTPIDSRNEYSVGFIGDVINKLITIHRHGFQHGNLGDRDILIENDKAMFIDFEDVTPHECGLRHKIIFDDLQPRSADFGCREIYNVAFMLRVWQELYVKFYGKVVYLPFIVRGAAKALVHRAQYSIESEEQYPQAIKDAERLIEEIEVWREWYNTITDEDRQFKFQPLQENDDNSGASAALDSSGQPR